MSNMNFHAVIFDMDGLMFDTERLGCRMWEKTGKENGYKIDNSIFPEIIGSTVKEAEKIFKKKFGRDFPFHSLRETRLTYTDQFLRNEGVPIKKGLIKLLAALKEKGIKRGVATSTERVRAEQMIKNAGIIGEFDCIVAGDDVKRSKPNPDIFLEAARRLKTDPAQCIVLEDSGRGIFAAIAAGMFPIMVPDIIQAAPEITEKKITVCASLEEAETLILSLL
ncbi:MAG: HAD family phosphatase [Spirochaetales bacterium]|nr:HAD family phosphatase [Spirochaetales bacterium]